MLVRPAPSADVAHATGGLTRTGAQSTRGCAILRAMLGVIDSSVTILLITLGIPVVLTLIVWGATSLRPGPRG